MSTKISRLPFSEDYEITGQVIFTRQPNSEDYLMTVVDPDTGDLTLDNLTINSGGQLLLPDGLEGAPSLVFASDPDTGLYLYGPNNFSITVGGVRTFASGPTGIYGIVNMFALANIGIQTDGGILTFGAGDDVVLGRDAANTLALKNANAEQQFNIYSGNGAYGLIKSKQELVTTTAAATAATAAGFIPDGAIPLAISTYVQTAITTAGLTGYSIGDGGDPDRWGAIVGHAVGTKSNNADWTATTIQAFIAAQAITLTAVGANFPAGGKIRVCMTYIMSSEPTS